MEAVGVLSNLLPSHTCAEYGYLACQGRLLQSTAARKELLLAKDSVNTWSSDLAESVRKRARFSDEGPRAAATTIKSAENADRTATFQHGLSEVSMVASSTQLKNPDMRSYPYTSLYLVMSLLSRMWTVTVGASKDTAGKDS